MNSFRRDPCKVCGGYLIEHHGEPFDVMCGWCQLHEDIRTSKVPPPPPPMRDGRGREVPLRVEVVQTPIEFAELPPPSQREQYAKLVGEVPPPTVEYRPRGQVNYAFGLLAYTMLCMAAGFAAGLAFGGGV